MSVVIVVGTTVWSSVIRRPADETVVPGEKVKGLTSVLTREPPPVATSIRFEDVTVPSGVTFRHFPVERASLLPEDMGSGVAVGDYDADGRDDLYLVNFSGNVIPGAPLDREGGSSRLYRNVGGGRFHDVTEAAGVGFVGYGMGATWGDYDNDGDLDLYVTAYGHNVLYRNLGDGTFEDVTTRSGVQDSRFSAGCSWADYDRDGDLDLYVCNYVAFVYRESDRDAVKQQYSTEQPYTLNPSSYAPQPNELFRNKGDGTFERVAGAVGVADPTGRSLSASWTDFNNDGWPDLYVANDISNNGVFLNKGDGTFEDIGAASLAADYRGAMGIAVSDFDDDLDQDLLITHWIAQENALYRNMTLDPTMGDSKEDHVWFMDDADQWGFGQASLDMVGWATDFCDFDNDGRRDLWLVNGSTLEQSQNHALLQPQRPFIFLNRGAAGFVDVAAQASAALAKPFVGRGGAQADIDDDGRVDLIISVHGGHAKILRNVSQPSGHWTRITLRQTGGNTYALGARVYVTAGGHTQMAEVGSSPSYLSQNELTLHFGLGKARQIESLRIVWPDGMQDQHHNLAVDQELPFVHSGSYPVPFATSPLQHDTAGNAAVEQPQRLKKIKASRSLSE